MKKSLLKSAFRDIKGSMSRFISIFGIVAIGVSFFTGLRATAPDMRLSADEYFDDSKLMDFRLVSTIGFDEEDITALSELKNAANATIYPAYFSDLIVSVEESTGTTNNSVARILSLTDDNFIPLNKFTLSNGRLPQNNNECLIFSSLLGSKLEIGTEIILESTNSNIHDIVNNDTYTIVGSFYSPLYIDKSTRGSTSVGNGEINSIIYIPESNFVSDYYTEVYISFDELAKLDSYSEEYKEKRDSLTKELEAIGETRLDERFSNIISEAEEKIAEAEAELAENISAFSNVPELGQEVLEKFTAAENEINEARQEIASLEKPKWYILDRNNNPGYSEYNENADRIRNISQVFPIFFVLVAALVCYTTMQRMVEENRLQIGTLKALGYNNASIIFKFMLYALIPTILGSTFGFLFGMKLFPNVIMSAYGMLYIIPEKQMPYDFILAGAASVVMAGVIIATVVSACWGELKEQPSQLMRPKAPKKGKRVLLERIPFIWKRIGFSQKVSIRNIFRYKRRMLMTVVGISGCTALLLTGFALYDCIGDIVPKQFEEISIYTGMAAVSHNITAEEEDILNEIFGEYDSNYIKFHQKQYDIKTIGGERTVKVYVSVPETTGYGGLKLEDVFKLRDRKTKEAFSIDNGAIITEKAATLLNVKSGDDIKISISETQSGNVRINSVTENYAYHYVYMNENEFIKTFNEKPEYNLIYFKNDLSNSENDKLAEKLLEEDFVLTVNFNRNIAENFKGMLNALNMVIGVIIAAAGGLAFIVLYNLTNINITERIREIATLKVLGFYDMEVDRYMFRENIILACLGDAVGLVLGIFLAQFIIESAEVDMAMFGREIHLMSFVYAAVITLAFAVLATFSMHFKLIKVDMAQSLKSVE